MVEPSHLAQENLKLIAELIECHRTEIEYMGQIGQFHADFRRIREIIEEAIEIEDDLTDAEREVLKIVCGEE